MMNILYSTFSKVHSTKGGTERTTITVASALTKLYGVRCFSIYEEPADTPKENCFIKEFYWRPKRELERNVEFLRSIIRENQIDCVVIQGAFIHVPRFRAAAQGTDCKIIFAHHFEPKSELVFGKFQKLIKSYPGSIIDFIRWVRNIMLHPFKVQYKKQYLSKAYREAYESADHVVLLCSEFIKLYSNFAQISETSKFTIIPNGLSFNYNFCYSDSIKQKEVLIVSRLDEVFKRLSLALRIWARVKHYSIAKDWKLRIVGHGRDRNVYERIIHDEAIPDVYLEGRQDPIPYYEKASIFMMTSKSESWGLTLTEAQQMGVVPVAFDTYASLRDIITDGDNGIIVKEGDLNGYVDHMLDLMTDNLLRRRLAENAISSTRRFSQDKIAALWLNLLSGK